MRRWIRGGILTFIGYLLSPLSWWNDIFINLPVAYAFAFPFGLISRKLFLPAMVFGYWLTNVAGLLLLHRGVKNLAEGEKGVSRKRSFAQDILISLAYTSVVILLVKLGWLKFPLEYFK
jgi:hypothetical protein